MADSARFPGYEVLAKRATPSWDERTRQVIDRRLRTARTASFLSPAEWLCADALCQRIVPHIASDAVPLVALLDAKLLHDEGSGFREVDMPYMREAWQLGLAALDVESAAACQGRPFSALRPGEQDALLRSMHEGRLDPGRWQGMDPQAFFKRRILVDVPPLYYCQPAAWNEMGFGGPASPRGYVRLDGDRPDPWEALEAKPGLEASIELRNRRVV